MTLLHIGGILMKRLTNTEIKQEELKILDDFSAFCLKFNLKYYLCGGTLLGAVRHRGFIPWDDDIDLMMPRPDYEKLLEIYPESDEYYIVASELSNFDRPFAKIIDRATIVKSKYKDGKMGLWIDILPVDGLPDDLNTVEDIYKRNDYYRRILKLSDCKLGEGKGLLKKASKFLLKPLANIYGVKKCIKEIEKYVSLYPYENCQYVGVVTNGLYGVGERMIKNEFEVSLDFLFEGRTLPGPSCWDSYLHGIYGDYMELPPVEKRQTHDMEVYWKDGGK